MQKATCTCLRRVTISIQWSIRTPIAESTRGVLDTSVVIDHDQINAERLPDEYAITSLCLSMRNRRACTAACLPPRGLRDNQAGHA